MTTISHNHAHSLSIRLAIGRILCILSRRKLIPIDLRRLFLVSSLEHFGFFPEQNTLPFLEIKSEEAFLDIGAYWGVYSLFIAPKCRHVYAWEPNPESFSQLLKNSQKFTNITAFQEALGEVKTTAKLFLHTYSGHDSLIKKNLDFTGKNVEVNIHRLDDYDFREKIGLVKIDTEGYEVPIIKGSLQTFQTHKPRLVIEVHEPCEFKTTKIRNLLPSYNWKRRRRLLHSLNARARVYEKTFHLIGYPEPKD